MLIHYWDTSYGDNDTGGHPGGGLLLPIDAHFEPLIRPDGTPWRNRVQTYDATFSNKPTSGIAMIQFKGELAPLPSLPGVSVFDDRILHYSPLIPQNSVIHPNTRTKITVIQDPYLQKRNSQAPFVQIRIEPAK